MSANTNSDDYYIPDPSPWPILGMVSLLTTLIGLALFMNGVAVGQWVMIAGLLLFGYLLYGWFRDVIDDSAQPDLRQ